jgi:hypothetical protein
MRRNLGRDAGGISLANFLIWTGIVVSSLIFLESWLEMTEQPFGLVKFFNNAGFDHFKPAKSPSKGIWHLTGWIGSACFVIMMLYSIRKRFKFMTDVGPIRYWLDIHMFLGIIGTVLVTVHSTYKFGGIVALSYWSAVLVAVSGFLGRYLYIHIPRSVSGNELRMDEVNTLMEELNAEIAKYSSNPRLAELIENTTPAKRGVAGDLSALLTMVADDFANIRSMGLVRAELKRDRKTPYHVKQRLFWLIKEKRRLLRSNMFLDVSHRLLHHWHIFHKPFAVVMFIVMFLHIAVYYVFKV